MTGYRNVLHPQRHDTESTTDYLRRMRNDFCLYGLALSTSVLAIATASILLYHIVYLMTSFVLGPESPVTPAYDWDYLSNQLHPFDSGEDYS